MPINLENQNIEEALKQMVYDLRVEIEKATRRQTEAEVTLTQTHTLLPRLRTLLGNVQYAINHLGGTENE